MSRNAFSRLRLDQLPRCDALQIRLIIDRFFHAIDPAPTECFRDDFTPSHTLLSSLLLKHLDPKLAFGRMIGLKPIGQFVRRQEAFRCLASWLKHRAGRPCSGGEECRRNSAFIEAAEISNDEPRERHEFAESFAEGRDRTPGAVQRVPCDPSFGQRFGETYSLRMCRHCRPAA